MRKKLSAAEAAELIKSAKQAPAGLSGKDKRLLRRLSKENPEALVEAMRISSPDVTEAISVLSQINGADATEK